MAKHRKRIHRSRRSKYFLARGVSQRPWGDEDKQMQTNTRQKLKREIDREIRSYD